MSSTSNYTNKIMNELWNDLAPGYFNYGRISPETDLDTVENLVQANEDMVLWIISKLGINKDSHVLDLACGKGMYTVRIAEITGCRYTGVELNSSYVEDECKKWAEEHGVSDQGEFYQGSMLEPPSHVKEQKYTHILSLGAMLYVHNDIDQFLETIASYSTAETKIFIWDFVCNKDWAECSELNRHMKMEYPIRSREDVLERMRNSRLALTEFQDFTPYIVPGYKIMERECRKRDPNMEFLTFPLLGKAFMDGTMSYVYYCLELQ